MTTKFLVQRDDREYFFDTIPEWAESPDYKVTKLSSGVPPEVVEKAMEEVEILQQIYELDEREIKVLKSRLEEALELVEIIYEFTSRDIINLMEAKGTLKLVAESCNKWLKPRE